ncbi:hypothetical protein FHX72_000724 [Pseudoclavibacter helvolus]|uniref:Uncharacterized protein n=1 Tax=Pseudoclavibacter helvolus TaxID=255205 RepID=A0A7W4YDZ0_9MICO|nr:hypothetical protein [Pseudoclavibacter helvolus]
MSAITNTNLTAIDEAGLRFIVGSRVTKAPHDLAKHFHWHGDSFTDGQVIDTITMRRHKPDPERVKTRREPVGTPTSTRSRGGRSGSTRGNEPSGTGTPSPCRRTAPWTSSRDAALRRRPGS